MPLKVYIEFDSKADGYDPHYSDLLKQSFVEWEKVTGNAVSFLFVPKEDEADIACYWTADPEKLGNGTENGNTTLITRAGVISHAQMMLKSREPAGSLPFTENTVLTVCRHEVGHALGLSWHSPEPSDVMFFSVPMADKAVEITARDKNTIRAIYATTIPLPALIADFETNPSNIKKYSHLAVVSIIILLFVGLLFGLRKKKKKRSK
jgi:predicted Zn-dependent protease